VDATQVAAEPADDGTMHCYRHPDRETWVRCGRCDRPICTKCAIQGPVGSRCRDCGRLRNDPLTTLSRRQLLLGIGVALAGGTVAGMVGIQLGLFLAIILGPIIGGLVGEAVLRVTGYKRGTKIRAIVLFGLAGGLLIAIPIDLALFVGAFDAGVPREVWRSVVPSIFLSGLVYLVAATVGAFARLW
jgi:hypothetical protein